MLHNLPRGLFVLSIDVSTEGTHTPRHASQLLASLRQHRIPATWALPLPGSKSLCGQLGAETVRHEIALLGDQTWVGPRAGRTRFSRELAQRMEWAQTNGIAIHTLALTDTELTENLDLLVKHQISVVRSPSTTGFQAQSLRFGVWNAPVSFQLPVKSWTLGGVEWSVGRALSKAAKAQDIVHVVADLASLSEPVEQGQLVRILGLVQRQVAKGQISPVTLHGLVNRLAPRKQASSRSVLRAA